MRSDAKIKPGDTVFIKPLIVSVVGETGLWFPCPASREYWLPYSVVDRVETPQLPVLTEDEEREAMRIYKRGDLSEMAATFLAIRTVLKMRQI